MGLNFNTQNKVQNATNSANNSNGLANITIRVDADCLFLIDGDYIEIELKANQLTKMPLPIGQHFLEFLYMDDPTVKIEKSVDWETAGKSYLVLANGLEDAIAEAKLKKAKKQAEKQAQEEAQEEVERKAQEEAERKAQEEEERKIKEEEERKVRASRDITYTITIYDVTNRMLSLMTMRESFGWKSREVSEKLEQLPFDVKTTKRPIEAKNLLNKLNKGGLVANISAMNALGEVVEITEIEEFND